MEYLYIGIAALILVVLLLISMMKMKHFRKPSNLVTLAMAKEGKLMAPLQKRALYSLGIGIVMAIALIVVVVLKDINTFDEDQGFRLIVYALWVGVPLAYLIVVNLTLRRPGQIDERDKLIMAKAPRVQFFALLFSLAAWTIALTEVFGDQGQVPVVYLTFVMISTIIISNIALSAGILIGYWRGVSNG
jgi:hypothetical protein